MGDYHLHLHPHGPTERGDPAPSVYPPGHIEAFVEAASARGVTELGFTEHLYRCVESADVLGLFWEQESRADLAEQARRFVESDRNLSLAAYVDVVAAAKDRGLPVLLGLEVDFLADSIDAVVRLLEPYPWDFLIGAVHWLGGWSVDHGEVAYEFERRGVRTAYEEYFELETALAASGTVDVLAHVDVVKKFGHRPGQEPIDLYEKVVRAAAASGTAVEVSSAGLSKPVAEVYPAPAFLRMFRDADVPITLASDAHRPHEAGWGHDEVVRAARAAGYTHRLRFHARQRETVPLH
ncbi:MAG: histidinol-phosphatase HisJ family protein [Acidimicrobiia bacterium]